MITKAKIAIDASGLKQRYIAEKLGIDAGLLSRYVTGEKPMPDTLAKRIANVLQVPVGQVRE